MTLYMAEVLLHLNNNILHISENDNGVSNLSNLVIKRPFKWNLSGIDTNAVEFYSSHISMYQVFHFLSYKISPK